MLIYGVMLLTCIIIGLANPEGFQFLDMQFLDMRNLGALLTQMPRLVILSVAVGILMISGEFDLSIGAVYVLGPYLMGMAIEGLGWPLWAAIGIAFASGLAVGIINGLATTKLKLPSFIATLAMMFFLRGVVRLAAGSGSSSSIKAQAVQPGETFEAALTGEIFGPVHAQILWVIAIAIVAYFLLNRHRLGNHMFAVGGNPDAAERTGINPVRVKMIAFVICSLLATFAGVIAATHVNTVAPQMTLIGLELQAIVACTIGGVFLFGGRGSVPGIVLGAAFVATVDDLLILTRFMIPDIAADLRRVVGHALGAAFGDAHVHGGKKAFRVSAVPGSRADADVVPAVRLDYVFKRGSGLFYSLDRVEGVIIYAQDGTQVLNFPQ